MDPCLKCGRFHAGDCGRTALDDQLKRGEQAERQVQSLLAIELSLRLEIERLRQVKRRALQLADDRAKEAVDLRAENERLRAALRELDAQSTATTEPNYVAVPAKLLADAANHEQIASKP